MSYSFYRCKSLNRLSSLYDFYLLTSRCVLLLFIFLFIDFISCKSLLFYSSDFGTTDLKFITLLVRSIYFYLSSKNDSNGDNDLLLGVFEAFLLIGDFAYWLAGAFVYILLLSTYSEVVFLKRFYWFGWVSLMTCVFDYLLFANVIFLKFEFSQLSLRIFLTSVSTLFLL